MQNLTPELSNFNSYNIDVNTFGVNDLFRKYEEIGFLYPAKQQVIQPYFEQIKSNWQNMLQSNEDLIWLLTSSYQKSEFSSITVLRNTLNGRIAQHLVSNGNPFSTLKIMLAAQNQAMYHCKEHEIHACQNWFRPNNRYAFKVFGSINNRLGPETSFIQQFQYLHIPQNAIQNMFSDNYTVKEIKSSDQELNRFLAGLSSEVFIKGEELDQPDLTLKKLDNMYQKVGLSKTRTVLKFVDSKTNKTVGCIIGNRAPLGLNFSFLENRAYYFIDHHLDNQAKHELIKFMNSSIKPYYSDFLPGFIPVVTNDLCSKHLLRIGAEFQRIYVQSIWLKGGFQDWYDHISSFISKIEKRYSKYAA